MVWRQGVKRFSIVSVSIGRMDDHNIRRREAPVAGSCLVGCSGSLGNVQFASKAACAISSPRVLGLAVWSQAVSCALTYAQITSCT